MTQPATTYKVLFVCLGNICRSPAAEAIFSDYAHKHQLKVTVDSAGTSNWHEGEKADQRMRTHARSRGYDITSLSRPFLPASDFDRFDLIVPMDDQNYYDLRAQARTQDDVDKIMKVSELIKSSSYTYIPDPYYGGASGFDLVIDLLEDVSENLCEYIAAIKHTKGN